MPRAGLDSANLRADSAAQISERVNEQARGAPGLVGAKTAVDANAAEIQRVKHVHQHAFGGNALRPPQDRVGGAMSRDKPADASWSGAALTPGQVCCSTDITPLQSLAYCYMCASLL